MQIVAPDISGSDKSDRHRVTRKKISRNRLPNAQSLPSIRHPAVAPLPLGNLLSKKHR
jgi:hypothetical protein